MEKFASDAVEFLPILMHGVALTIIGVLTSWQIGSKLVSGS